MANPDCGETFRAEAQDLLDRLEQALLDLDQRPDDRELIDGAFRALHTIKGSGAMFGFEHVAAFTHDFETAFDRVRKGSAPASRELVAVALAAKDHIRTLIDRPGAGGCRRRRGDPRRPRPRWSAAQPSRRKPRSSRPSPKPATTARTRRPFGTCTSACRSTPSSTAPTRC